jgi:hypothetical protein
MENIQRTSRLESQGLTSIPLYFAFQRYRLPRSGAIPASASFSMGDDLFFVESTLSHDCQTAPVNNLQCADLHPGWPDAQLTPPALAQGLEVGTSTWMMLFLRANRVETPGFNRNKSSIYPIV